jgi:hypothetical protein
MSDNLIVPRTDHLVYAVPDLAQAVEEIGAAWGVRPVMGGQHPTGTHNALLSLGATTYLEIIAVDPSQAVTSGRSFGLDAALAGPVLRTWAVAVDDLAGLVTQSQAKGYEPGAIQNGARRRPDGAQLSWRSTQWRAGWPPLGDGIVPFVIEWGAGTPHPASDSPQGCRLVSLSATHPQAGEVQAALDALGLPLQVQPGDRPRLIATIETPRGEMTIG